MSKPILPRIDPEVRYSDRSLLAFGGGQFANYLEKAIMIFQFAHPTVLLLTVN